MKFKIKITYNWEDNEFFVFIDEIKELYGTGETESSALLDFFEKYECEYSGFKCFNSIWVRNKISTLQLTEEL